MAARTLPRLLAQCGVRPPVCRQAGVQLQRRWSSQGTHRLSTIEVAGQTYRTDQWTSATPTILQRVGRNLHLQEDHPLNIIKRRIEDFFNTNPHGPKFDVYDSLSPLVTPQMNFDSILVPPDHVSRAPNDTYYLNSDWLLRTHTSAHQVQLMKGGSDHFLAVGDVYRRDEIDASHYPVFHQMEGLRLFTAAELQARGLVGGLFEDGIETPQKQGCHRQEVAHMLERDLKMTLEGLVRHLFGDVQLRWIDTTFPFTTPSFEIEIFFNNNWLEVLGCGVTKQKVISNAGIEDKVGWAFGLGLERLAMVLFGIPDIRLFWSTDPRFLDQFKGASPGLVFKSFSKHPPCFKDVSFWINTDAFTDNNFFEIVRGEAGDIVEDVKLVDDFVHPKTKRRSKCFRITYRSMDRTVTNAEINEMQEAVRSRIAKELDVDLR